MMNSNIMEKALEQGIRLAVVPVECLSDVKSDMVLLEQENTLNEMQKGIIHNDYVLNVPSLDFKPKSVVVAVWQLKLATAVFHHNKKTVSCLLDDSVSNTDVHDRLSKLFAESGFALEYFFWMPHKCFAVRSGLCEYGRNNITYAGDWGSFIRIGTYLSDIPADQYIWREVKNAKICDSCGKCIKNCPTKAILPDRFLIDNEICLAHLNVSDTRPIPEWVPKSVHHRIFECTRCQDICPMNKGRLTGLETIEFDDEETSAILNSETFGDFPEGVRKKLWYYDNGNPFNCIPRNLALMLENAG